MVYRKGQGRSRNSGRLAMLLGCLISLPLAACGEEEASVSGGQPAENGTTVTPAVHNEPAMPAGAVAEAPAPMEPSPTPTPAADSEPRTVDLNAWAKVKKGLSEDEVIGLLGEPQQKMDAGMGGIVAWMYSAKGFSSPIAGVIFRAGEVYDVQAPQGKMLDQLGIKYIALGSTGAAGDDDDDSGPGTGTGTKKPKEKVKPPAPKLKDLPAMIDGSPAWFFQERYDMLKEGMSTDEVRRILGEPCRVQKNARSLVWLYGWSYGWDTGRRSKNEAYFTVWFDDGDSPPTIDSFSDFPGTDNASHQEKWHALRESWGCSKDGWPDWMDPTYWLPLTEAMEPPEIRKLLGDPHPDSERMTWYYDCTYPGGTFWASLWFKDEDFPGLRAYNEPSFIEATRVRNAADSPKAFEVPQWAHSYVWRLVYHDFYAHLTDLTNDRRVSPADFRENLGEPQKETWEEIEGPFGPTWQRTFHYADGSVTWLTDVPTSLDKEKVRPEEGRLIALVPPTDVLEMMLSAIAPNASPGWAQLLREIPVEPDEDWLFSCISKNPEVTSYKKIVARLGEPSRVGSAGINFRKEDIAKLQGRSPADGLEYRTRLLRFADEGELGVVFESRSDDTKFYSEERYKACPAWIWMISPPTVRERPSWTGPVRWRNLAENNVARYQQEGLRFYLGEIDLLDLLGMPQEVRWTKHPLSRYEYWVATMTYGDGHIVMRSELKVEDHSAEPTLVEAFLPDGRERGFKDGHLMDLVPPSQASIDAAAGGVSLKLARPDYTPPGLEGWPRSFQADRWHLFLYRGCGAKWVRHILGEPDSIEDDKREIIWKYGPFQNNGQRWNSGQIEFSTEGSMREFKLPKRKD